MLYHGILIGIIGGLMSGTLGVSSGGALVPLSVLLLGADQRVAQAISLVAQIFPTSLSGLRHYARSGHGVSWRSLAFIGSGIVGGGITGAFLASGVADRGLRWGFVGYLVLLEVLLIVRPPRARANVAAGSPPAAQSGTLEASQPTAPPPRLNGAGLIAVGFVAGMSSGLLGIGGGLAITALGGGILKLRQHQAQALSLAATALPLTLPAAWSYVHKGVPVPALAITGIVAGLWVGTMVGSRIATWLSAKTLRYALVALVAAMALFMAWKASNSATAQGDQAAAAADTGAFTATRSVNCRIHSVIFAASQPNSVRTAAAVCDPWGLPRSTTALTPML
jgi:uncharacterized protein